MKKKPFSVIAFNGSPRKESNTARYIEEALKPLEEGGNSIKMIKTGGNRVRGCTACMKCREKGDGRCIFDDDPVNEWIEAMRYADVLLIGSPVYFSDLTTEVKALIDRAGYALRGLPENPLSRKIGAGIAVARRAGHTHTLMSINQFFFINDMIVPGSSYWNVGLARAAGDAENDQEGLVTMKRLGENIQWLLEKLH
jgi:multimeric flavodoxin WrbA